MGTLKNHKTKLGMKNKTKFCVMLLVACAFSVQMNAQLMIAENGNVGIGNNAPLSQLSIVTILE